MFSTPPPPFLNFVADNATSGTADAQAETGHADGSSAGATSYTQDQIDQVVSGASAEKFEDLPAWAQKSLREAQKQAGDTRMASKAALADAAAKATKDLTDKLAVALGLKPDAAQDPAALTASLTKAQQDALNSARELAVFKQAATAGADPSKLLDRASFLTSIAGIDPTDGAAIKTAIETAIAADQTLKATRAVGASTVETPGGPGEQGQITEAQLAQMTPEQIADAYEKGLLKSLL